MNNTRIEKQQKFISYDGVELFYRHWPAVNASENAPAIVLFHRGHEHSARMAHLVDELDLPDYQFFAWDARGHGESQGERGDAESFSALVRDADCFIQHIKQLHQLQDQDLAIIAQSVGAVIASTWVHDYAPNIRALVLGSPAFSIKLYVPFAVTGLKLLKKYKGNFFVNSYIKPWLLTHDKARVASYTEDKLITRPISVRVLLDLYSTSDRVVQDAGAIHVPTQVLVSGSDYVVRRKPQKQFFDHLGSSIKEYHVLPGFYHDTFGERDRYLAIERAKRFITTCFAKPIQPVSLLDADKIGDTRAESDSLALPASCCVKRLYWTLTRMGLKTVGRLSDGVKVGIKTGFDSGSSLDYVYRNQPSGDLGIGRWMDAVYLQSIGWRGIRQRKVNMEELLTLTIKKLQAHGKEVNLVDIAAGHGRYILDAVKQLDVLPHAILLRDYSDINVRDGKALIQEKGLANIAGFEKGDAFNREELANLELKPTLAVVSGLYELFGDNQMVSNSLAGLAESMEEGSYLIYTGQPWHPQLEFIARALTSHREGQAWVMRRRTQLEMDQLVEAAGFRKITMRIDPWGIFTVSLAQRIKHD